MPYQRAMGLLAMIALMAGCGKEPGTTHVVSFRDNGAVTGSISLQKGGVALRAPGAPTALIDAAGDLRIDRRSTPLNPAQRALLQDYYRNVLAMNEHDMATDLAGAAAGAQTAKRVVQHVASGDAGNIDREMQAKSPQVTEAALKTCHDLAGIKTAQDKLAGQLAAFKPYAGMIQASAVAGCEEGTARRG